MYDKPPSINVVENGERLILERRWLNMSSLGVVLFGVVWNVFLILYARQSLLSAADPEERLLLIPLGIVGLIAAYFALASGLNRTRLTVDQHRLSVTHAPIPWRNKTLARDELQEIVVKSYTSRGSRRNQRRTTFAVLAQLKDGKQKRLIGDLSNSAEAYFIKQAFDQSMS